MKTKSLAIGQIFLLVSFSFAFSFVMGESVSAQSPWRVAVPGADESLSLSDYNALADHFGKESGVSLLQTPPGASGGGVLEIGSLVDGKWVAKAGGDSILNTGTGAVFSSSGESLGTLKEGVFTAGGAGSGGLLGSGKGTLGGLFGGEFFGTGGTAGALSGLTTGLVWGGIVYAGVSLLGGMFGLSDSQTQAAAMAAGAGVFTWQSLNYLGQPGGWLEGSFLAEYSGLIGIGVGVAIFVMTYKKEKTEIITFECHQWEAPTGGSSCEKCNEDPLRPCTLYRCKSLGQACELVNEGEEGEEMCVWVNKNDVTAPTITPLEDALAPAGLQYTRDGEGFRIIQTGAAGGCIEAFTRLEFGVETNEPAQCRISLTNDETYEEMDYYFGESSLYDLEHIQTRFRVPNPFAEEGEEADAPEIHNDGVYTLYVRCRDANGNGEDSAAVPFRFCVNRGPDTKAPIIEGFLIPDGSPVQYEIDTIEGFEVYTNEPSRCRWSSLDKLYENMENEMSCQTGLYQVNGNLQYVCRGDLAPITDREDNTFYFRCEDLEGNTMQESETLTLKGTEPLSILEVGPEEDILGATTLVEVNLTVETAHGCCEGEATCYYEFSEDGDFNVAMLGAGTSQHTQPIALGQGSYTVYYRCIDDGGNAEESSTSFNVVVDTAEPLIARVFRDGNNLKVITSEEAKCVYSENGCSYEFDSGNPMSYEDSSTGNRITHLTAWNRDTTYYVKCEDFQGKRVDPNECSIIIQGAEF